jgi:hypothetical protein
VRHPHHTISRLAVAQLSATALLAVQPDVFTYSSLGMRLLRALARAPLRHMTRDALQLSQFCWSWVRVHVCVCVCHEPACACVCVCLCP